MKAYQSVPGRDLRALALTASVVLTAMGITALAPAAAQTPTAPSAPAAQGPAARPDSSTSLRMTSAKRHVLSGGLAKVRGVIASRSSGRTVYLQLRTRKGWRTVDRDRTGHRGRFSTAWRPTTVGRYRLRVRMRAPDAAPPADRGARRAVTRRTRARVNVYRTGHASWYGPGFYGNRTACGGTLGTGTVGVAHKWLPCGTRVTFRYRGRTVAAKVIDRGPFVAGREWDLTGATKRQLGFPSTGTVWAAH